MATLVEYINHSYKDNQENNSISNMFELMRRIENPLITPIGYINKTPEDSLITLMNDYYVVKYEDIYIPSRSEYINKNEGLKISFVPDGIGLVGTIEMLESEPNFNKAKHGGLSLEKKQLIIHNIKNSIIPINRYKEPLRHEVADKYSLILYSLGLQMSSKNLISLSTHEDYGKPQPQCEILS